MEFAIESLPAERRGLRDERLWQWLPEESCIGDSALLAVEVHAPSADAGDLSASDMRFVDLANDVAAVERLQHIEVEQLVVDEQGSDRLGLDAIAGDPSGPDLTASGCLGLVLVLDVAPVEFDSAVFQRVLVAADLDFSADCGLRLPLSASMTGKVWIFKVFLALLTFL